MHELSIATSILDIVSREIGGRFGRGSAAIRKGGVEVDGNFGRRGVGIGEGKIESVGDGVGGVGGMCCVDAADGRLESVTVRIGTLSGIEPDALDFAWTVARESGGFSDARLVIETVPVRAKCRACGDRFGIDAGVGECPRCGPVAFEVVEGREIEVTRIVWWEAPIDQSEGAA